MKQYQFNENGVCTNPDYYGTRDGQQDCNYISTALAPNGLWSMGFRWQTVGDQYAGGCGGANAHGKYATQREAVLEGVRFMQHLISAHRIKKENAEAIQACIDLAYSEVTQLSLF